VEGDSLNRLAVCPSLGELEAFCAGRLTAEALEAVGNHVSGCRQCEETLFRLEGRTDDLVSRLRKHLEGCSAEEISTTLQIVPLKFDLPAKVGQYELVELLGQGGMGTVYKAWQAHPRRVVAVKFALLRGSAGAGGFARIQREVEALGRLVHPNIVHVYELALHAGMPFFAMEYVDGGCLARRLAGTPMAERDAALLVSTLARAVAFAHEKGVIHRDIKPANVLLGTDGTAKLTDFGLAKLRDDEAGLSQPSLTTSDAVLGTASYMAPEQAAGDGKAVSPLTDVYGLGTVLYEALTGHPPFRAETVLATLDLVRTTQPVPPSGLGIRISARLEEICLKCLEKVPHRRYPSAEALADVLDRWLRGEAGSDWPLRIRRYARKFRWWLTAALLGTLAVILTLVLSAVNDPDRPIRQIERKLARGEEVELIPLEGGPAWSRWCIQEDEGRAPALQSGHFTVQSWGLALLELVRDPQVDAYVFSAEIRHLESDATVGGQVGLYFAHREYQRSGGNIHQFICLSFDDLFGVKAPPVAPKLAKVGPARLDNPFGFTQYVCTAGVLGQQYHNWQLGGKYRRLFSPAGKGETSWRKVEVEVKAEEIRAVWESGPAVTWSLQEHTEVTKSMLVDLGRRLPDNFWVREVRPEIATRGGIGLFVMRGAASFRSVRVKPLKEG
jgi:serine/threonine-protein kinase